MNQSFVFARLPASTLFATFSAVTLLWVLLAGTPVNAQVFTAPSDWKEADVPPPPAYDMAKLLTFDVARSSSLVFGVDPASFSISKSDSVVRYVMVASNSSGAKNAMYEGLRCTTGEVKTYARAKSDGTWAVVTKPEWKSVYDPTIARHSLHFAQAGACQGATPVSSVRELVKMLTTPLSNTSN